MNFSKLNLKTILNYNNTFHLNLEVALFIKRLMKITLLINDINLY